MFLWVFVLLHLSRQNSAEASGQDKTSKDNHLEVKKVRMPLRRDASLGIGKHAICKTQAKGQGALRRHGGSEFSSQGIARVSTTCFHERKTVLVFAVNFVLRVSRKSTNVASALALNSRTRV